MVMLWGEAGVMLYNDAYSVFAGGRHPELLGSNVRDGWPEVADFNDNVMRVGLSGGTLHYKDQELTLYRHGRPEQVWMNLDYSPVLDDNGQPGGVLAIVLETTERVKADAALRESESRLRLAIDGAQLGLWDWDLVAMRGWWSPRTAEIMGVASGENITVEQRRERVHPDDHAKLQATLESSLGTGNEFTLEYRIVRPDGDIRHIASRGIVIRDADGQPVRTTGTVLDVTEERQAEARLRESEGRLRRAQDAGGIGSYEWDLATGEGKQSDSMLALIGLTPGRAYSLKEIVSTVLDEDMPQVRETIAAIGSGADRCETEYRVRGPDGEPCWIADVGQTERDASGRPARWVGVVQDITRRKTAELALRSSEERLRLGLEAGLMVTWELDLETGVIVRSTNAEEIFGAGTMSGDFEGRMFDEEIAANRTKVEAAIEGRAAVYDNEFRYRHPDGRVLWLHNRGRVIRDGQGTARRMHGVCVDITARKAAEERLRESEARLRTLTNVLPAFIWFANADGRLTYFNDRWYEYTGQTPEVALPDGWVAMIHPEDAPVTAAAWAHALATGTSYENECRYRRHDGEYRWHVARAEPLPDVNGRIVGWAGTSADVHDRRAAAERLRESEDRFRHLADNAPVMVWVTEADGSCSYLSKSWYEFTGQTPETGLGFGWLKATHPDDAAYAERLFLEANAKHEPFRLEYRLRGRDGDYRWAIDAAAPRFGADGEFLGYVGSVIDISERREAEEAVRRLNDELQDRIKAEVAEREAALQQLHEAQKLETLGQLTGGVAHDFNNLLTPIVGSLDLLKRRLPDDPRTERLIDGALQAADRARTLVSRLLAFGRRQLLQPRPTDVATLLRGMTDLIQRSIGQHIAVVVEPAAILPPAQVDPNQLELAVLNLAVNARDAMPGGGTLTITAHPEVAARQNAQGLKPGRYVKLSVIDTGIGMDAATLKRAVEPFFTTKGVGKGTGLGLSMIHGLAGQMGGALRLSSTVGIGTRVDIWLPVAEAAIETPVAAAASLTSAPANSATILLVDDEDLVRAGATEMLLDLGYRVVEASSAAEALALLERDPAVDALVTDYLMPGMNGGELIVAARKLRPRLPALLVSGYATLDGVDPNVPLLAKPFRHEEFAEAVAAVLDADKIVPFRRTVEPAG